MSLQVTQALHQLLNGVQRPNSTNLAAKPGIIRARTTSPQLPNLGSLLQNAAPDTQLQPQKYFNQTRPQVGVPRWNLHYLANPRPDDPNWRPTFNPTDFQWNGQLGPLPPLAKNFVPANHQSLLTRLRNLF